MKRFRYDTLLEMYSVMNICIQMESSFLNKTEIQSSNFAK